MKNTLMLIGVSKDEDGFYIRLGSDNVHYFKDTPKRESTKEKYAKQLKRNAMHEIVEVYAMESDDYGKLSQCSRDESVEILRSEGKRIL